MPNRVIAEGLGFPEGPAFDREGNLYVVEIRAGQVARITPSGERSVFAVTGGGPNGAAFGPDGFLYVCNNGGFPSRERQREAGRVERISPAGDVSALITEVDGTPLASPNDLAFDEHGNFYFTDPVPPASREFSEAPAGRVCYAETNGSARRVHTGLKFPNGVGFSPDGRGLVVCESVTGKLHRFEILAPGVLGEPREFADLGQGIIPDGFAFDEEGNVLCCGFESGKVHVFGPGGGTKLAEIECEDKRVTNVCFGGPEHRTLYITESGMGRVVATDWRNRGMMLFGDR